MDNIIVDTINEYWRRLKKALYNYILGMVNYMTVSVKLYSLSLLIWLIQTVYHGLCRVVRVVRHLCQALINAYVNYWHITVKSQRKQLITSSYIANVQTRFLAGDIGHLLRLRSRTFHQRTKATHRIAGVLLRFVRAMRSRRFVVFFTVSNLCALLWWLFYTYGPLLY